MSLAQVYLESGDEHLIVLTGLLGSPEIFMYDVHRGFHDDREILPKCRQRVMEQLLYDDHDFDDNVDIRATLKFTERLDERVQHIENSGRTKRSITPSWNPGIDVRDWSPADCDLPVHFLASVFAQKISQNLQGCAYQNVNIGF